MKNLLENITEALEISNGDNAYLEFKEEIEGEMQKFINDGYRIENAEDFGIKYEDLPMTDGEREFWADYKKILVADKYNSARGYWVLR